MRNQCGVDREDDRRIQRGMGRGDEDDRRIQRGMGRGDGEALTYIPTLAEMETQTGQSVSRLI